HGERSGTVLEPYLTDQWYVDAKVLAQPAIRAVEEGRIVLEPKAWEKTFFEWMRNIEPWCISRQLWWGHRIPAWWGPDGRVFVEESEEAARAAAYEHYGRQEPLRQDEDVLDTWFSSGLWPFSTLGWPEATDDLRRFYPTHTLVTGFDIIFYWVARMMMMGLKFMGDVPFRRVVFNALVRDAEGRKMSKTKGNVLDPLELIDEYGCDALRFTLTALSGQARDIRLSRERIEGYRNFGTKVWSAARFCQMNDCTYDADFDPGAATLTVNRWVRSEAAKTIEAVTDALDRCAFSEAATAIYRFSWNVLCDWYLELVKPVLAGDDAAAKAETRAMAAWTLRLCLKLLHPISPFITETLWREFSDSSDGLLITAAWPPAKPDWIDPEASAELDWLIQLVDAVRSVCAETSVPAKARPALVLVGASAVTRERLKRYGVQIRRLARLSSIELADAAPAGAVQFVAGEATGAIAIAGLVDVASERARLAKEIAALTADADKTARKLANADFVARAPEEVVEENRERLAEAQAARAKLEGALQRLESVA
ncbi:MAG TPA: class I tRNA ligase family protein, partial [Caulobacteraceae bacterium]|nr:class I tRNA ligase family protein [Caulobacteraceae bacterium]